MAQEEIYEQVGKIKTNVLVLFVVGNVIGLVTHIFFLVVLSLIQKQGISVQLDDENVKMIVSFVLIIIAHELLHYVAFWLLCGIDRRYLYFGFNLRWLAPYCGFRTIIPVGCYRVVLIFPLIVTGCVCIVLFCVFLSYWTTMAISCAVTISTKDIVDFIKARKFNQDYFIPPHSPEFGTHLVLRKKENADVEISP